MPQIVLDHTLRELYCLDEPQGPNIVVVNAIPTAETQMITGLPIPIKYAYQSPGIWTRDPDMLVRLYLQVVAQMLGFIAGDMPQIHFDLENVGLAHRDEAYQTYIQLTPEQRPQLSFVAQPSEIQLPAGAEIAIITPMDCLLCLPHAVDPDLHYDLLSKRTLAISTLPSPASEVLDTVLQPGEAYDEQTMDAEISRMTNIVTARACPFVVKMPQSLSSQGVFLVRLDSEKHDVVGVIRRELKRSLTIMRRWPSSMPTSNIILQKLISPRESVAIAFFVTKRGRTIFTSCCLQLVDTHGHREAGYISYRKQDHYQRKYARTLELLSQYIHSEGYFGPAGADVITNHDGEQFVIDMNVRVTGTHPLGFLKRHFSAERGLHKAIEFFPFFMQCRRETFENAFRKQLQSGALIVKGWCHDKKGKISITGLILAAENESKLRTFIDEINVYKVPG
ncbi:MAG: hypothetical protein Q9169_002096 [Polycauliona sp. 2 TL-2023]